MNAPSHRKFRGLIRPFHVTVSLAIVVVCALIAEFPPVRADDGVVLFRRDHFTPAQIIQDTLGSPDQTPLVVPRSRSGGDSETLHTPGETYTGWPVVISGDTLFYVYRNLGGFQPWERARKVISQIEAVINNPGYVNTPLSLRESIGGTEVACGDIIITVVTQEDARVIGGLRQEIANGYLTAIHQVVERERARRSPRALIFGLLFTALATVGLIVFWRLISVLSHRLKDKLTGRHVLTFGPGVHAHTTSQERRADRIIATVKSIRILVQLTLLYAYVTVVTGFFYATQGLHVSLNRQLRGLMEWGGPSFVGFLPQLFILATIATVTYITLQLLRLLFVGVSRGSVRWPGFHPEWAHPTYRIVSIVIMLVALIVATPHLPGYGSPAFTMVAIIVGAMLALGSVVIVANGIAGLIIGFTSPYNVGEHVRVAGTTGDVVAWTLMVTRLRNNKNIEVTIPNAIVMANPIVNFSRTGSRRGMILPTQVTVGYEVQWVKVHELLLTAARRTPHVLKDPAPFVIQKKLDPDAAVYELNVYIDNPSGSALIYSALHQYILDEFTRADVQIHGSPHGPDGWTREPVEEYLPGTPAARHFHVFPPLRRAFKREHTAPPEQEDTPE